jgi:formyl-CoA transferase
MDQPLSGIRVVDLTQVYSGPYATFLLAEAGADVVKVEPPGGERLRLASGSAATPFAMFNAGKRSVTVDLARSEGREALRGLLARADVLVDNFRPGVLTSHGFDDAALSAINPQLVRASLSGFGTTGPYRDYPALDIVVQAIVGVIETTGFADGPPVKAGAALADILGGVHLYGAIVTALLHRARTGEALPVETSMLAATYPAMASSLGWASEAAPEAVLRTGNRHGGGRVCPYDLYPTTDGHIAIICTTDRHWQRLCALLGLEALGNDPDLATMAGRLQQAARIDGAVAERTACMTRDALFALLGAGGVPCGPARRLQEVLDDPHLLATGAIERVAHPHYGALTLPRSAIRFPTLSRSDYRPSPALGGDLAGADTPLFPQRIAP